MELAIIQNHLGYLVNPRCLTITILLLSSCLKPKEWNGHIMEEEKDWKGIKFSPKPTYLSASRNVT